MDKVLPVGKAKAALAIIAALTFGLTIAYWAIIKAFQVKGLPLDFMMFGLYLAFFLLAWLGMRREKIALPVTIRSILEALAWSLIGWLVFALLIRLLGLSRLSEEFSALGKTPAWKIGLGILRIWIFVGMGEELLFRGYFLNAFGRRFAAGSDKARTAKAILASSAFFALWHLPTRIISVFSGELDLPNLLLSLAVMFVYGLGFSYLFVRSKNILLVGLVHGLMDLPLVGKDTQLSFIILAVAIICVEISRAARRKTGDAASG